MVALPCSTLGRRCLPNSQELVIPPQTAAPCAGSCPAAAAVHRMQYTLHLSGDQQVRTHKEIKEKLCQNPNITEDTITEDIMASLSYGHKNQDNKANNRL
jgi:hypothetical protein